MVSLRDEEVDKPSPVLAHNGVLNDSSVVYAKEDVHNATLAACPDSCFDLDFVVGMLYSRLSWQGILFCC